MEVFDSVLMDVEGEESVDEVVEDAPSEAVVAENLEEVARRLRVRVDCIAID